ncbi:TraX family protein [Paenibacillus kandeliae]|uniref:TraX family protein n=1 Tax=Paenibacillus kandeliae TaxID=3231269 RepID=UPI00345832AA
MLQWLAMITMLIDHLGYAFFPDERYLRVIGRLAFPIYCYFIVVGYSYTRNKGTYASRLLTIAVLAQFPFMFAFNIQNLNVVFTLLFGLLLIIAIDRIPKRYVALSILLALVVAWIAEVLHTDYGAYGILLILIFRYAKGYWRVLLHLVMDILFVLGHLNSSIQVYSILATLLITISEQMQAQHTAKSPAERPSWLGWLQPPRWLWRAFYPAHLAIIAIIVQGSAYGYL